MSKNHNFDDEMASFENKTVQFLQNLHYYTKEMKFFLGWIPSFDVKIPGIKTNIDESTSIPRCDFSTCVTFKTLIIQYQHWFPLRHMEKSPRMG